MLLKWHALTLRQALLLHCVTVVHVAMTDADIVHSAAPIEVTAQTVSTNDCYVLMVIVMAVFVSVTYFDSVLWCSLKPVYTAVSATISKPQPAQT
jgi:hypothetical protein